MIAVATLVAAFLIVGLVVLGSAFAGGRRREPAGKPSHASNALLYTGVAFVCVGIGLLLPLYLLIKNTDNADRKSANVHINAAQAKGRELFASNCATCHTLKGANADGATGPNLDVLRPPAGLVENAILLGRANGRGNMPAGLLTGEDAKNVAAFVDAVAGRADTTTSTTAGGGEAPATPAAPAAAPAATAPKPAAPAAPSGGTTQASAEGKQLFTQNCASCHTLKADGATGQVGPNLDTLKPSAAVVARQVTAGGGGMPAFKGQLTDAQIKALAAYVSSSAGA